MSTHLKHFEIYYQIPHGNEDLIIPIPCVHVDPINTLKLISSGLGGATGPEMRVKFI